ncbi:MAG: hypothetical protein A2Y17_09430 [Clostridiales bacterium GWF2_38_85]|nr:MAG: hypothetical protein A2Y17_09430 [Clostridiales bacterium GWF2_38_85]HBL83581.1 insulinase family protein [Clostridiales bacterium]
MNNITEKVNSTVNERYFQINHKSGLNIFVIPKKHSTAFAIIGTNYGSMDRTFKTDSDADFITVPDGIAHFLEHKLFENEDGEDTFIRYARYGGNANAYTSFDKTAYLFSCTENFNENLKVLLDFVQAPYFTDASVQKEIGIIGQEIRMYDDNPGWQVFFNLLKALYIENPIQIDIAGTVESIAKITPEILYRCYNTFYNLNNMTLVVCGDVTSNQVLAVADKVLKNSKDINIERVPLDEPRQINEKHVTKNLEVAMPMITVGIKDKTPSQDIESLKRHAANEILLQMLFGNSSEFYTYAYNKRIITQNFSASAELGRNFAFVEIGGSTPDPDMLYSEIVDEINKKRILLFDKIDFERAKKVLYSSNLTSFDSTEDIANGFLRLHLLGGDLLDYPEIIASVSYEYACELFLDMYKEEYMASSIVFPNKK